MNDISRLKKETALYGGLVALVCGIISLFILGFHLQFLYALLLGTCISIVNFYLLAYFSQKVMTTGNRWLASAGYLVRMCLYGYAFYICIKMSLIAGAGCCIGFLTLRIPLFYKYGIKAKFDKKRKVRPEVQAMYEEDDRKADDKYYGREED